MSQQISSCYSNLVNKIVSEYAVVVFSNNYQRDAFLPLKILSQYPIQSVKTLNLDETVDEKLYLQGIKEITGSDTLPKVFIGGHVIKSNDIITGHSDGKLIELLTKVGAISLGPGIQS